MNRWINSIAGMVFVLFFPGQVTAQPVNDDFHSAYAITSFPLMVSGDNFDATMETGEPRPVGWETVASQSVWFVWNSEFDGDVQLDTIGSDFDSMLAVWVGDSLTNLTLLAQNDYYGIYTDSAIFGTASSGTTYFISIYGYDYSAGNFILSLTNDTKSRISGTVTDTNGVPLQDIEASAYQESYGFWSYTGLSTESDVNGHYTIRGLTAGTYRVVFNDWQNRQFASVAYSNASSEEAGTDIVVGELETITNINAVLLPGASISGIVTNSAGDPLPDIYVEVFKTNSYGGLTYYRSYTTDANGIYNASGLQAGVYRLSFIDFNSIYLSEAYDNAESIYVGTDITCNTSEMVDGINVGLTAGTKISGYVFEPDGVTPISNLTVTAYADSGFGWYAIFPETYTDGAGFYQITGLAPGTHLVRFGGGAGEPYVPEYYDDAVDINDAFWIDAEFEDNFTNINATMTLGGGIAGQVTQTDGTPIENVNVSLYQTNMLGEWIDTGIYASTDTNGFYELIGLTEGDYRLQFVDWYSQYIGEFYENATNVDAATTITVSGSTTVTNVNAALVKYGSISGSVRGPANKWLLGGVLVELYHTNNLTTPIASDYTIQGNFSFIQLVPDSYILRAVDDVFGIYSNQVFSGRQDLAGGDPVVVGDGESVTNVHFTMSAYASISGTVTQPDGTNGIGGVSVVLFNDYGFGMNQIGSDVTDTNGSYIVYGMPGQHHVIYFAETNGLFLSEYYSNVVADAEATRIFIDGITNITGIDASLEFASSVSGTVTGPDGVTPVTNIFVAVYRPDSSMADYTFTDSNGMYIVNGLVSNSYRVEFYDFQNYYIKQYYSNVATLAEAHYIELTNGAHATGIDASLLVGAIVTGRVTATDGTTGISSAYVQLVEDDGAGGWTFVRGGGVDIDGHYQLAGIPAGTYRMNASAYGYFEQVFSNASSLETGTDITVTNGEIRAVGFSLVQAALISGIVYNNDGSSGIDGISVNLYRTNETSGWDFVTQTFSYGGGFYIFDALAPATYRVEFLDQSLTPVYVPQSYSNGTSYLDGTSIVAAEGANISTINVFLAAYGNIQGSVFDPGFSPTGGVTVSAYRSNSTGVFALVQFSETALDGSFSISTLPPGTYRLLINSNEMYNAQSYSNKPSLELGDNIALGSGEILTGFNFVLVHSVTNAPDSDSDGDGVPDTWEMLYFGTTSASATNITANGVNTMLEAYIADLDPNNPTSVVRLAAVSNAPAGTIQVVINPSSTGRVYGMYWTTNLSLPPELWTLYPPERAGTGSAVGFAVTNPASAGAYFRTGVRLPD